MSGIESVFAGPAPAASPSIAATRGSVVSCAPAATSAVATAGEDALSRAATQPSADRAQHAPALDTRCIASASAQRLVEERDRRARARVAVLALQAHAGPLAREADLARALDRQVGALVDRQLASLEHRAARVQEL